MTGVAEIGHGVLQETLKACHMRIVTDAAFVFGYRLMDYTVLEFLFVVAGKTSLFGKYRADESNAEKKSQTKN